MGARRGTAVVSPSLGTSIGVLLELFTASGDRVVIQPPVFTDFKALIRDGGREPVRNSLLLVHGTDARTAARFEQVSSRLHLTRNNVFSLAATTAADEHGDDWLDRLLRRPEQAADQLRDRLPSPLGLIAPEGPTSPGSTCGVPGWTCRRSRGGWRKRRGSRSAPATGSGARTPASHG